MPQRSKRDRRDSPADGSKDSLQEALDRTRSSRDLRFFFITGAHASEPLALRSAGRNVGGGVITELRDLADRSALLWKLGMNHNLTGRLDFVARTAHYKIGTGPWRLAREGQVFTASEDGYDVGPQPRNEPSPLDTFDAVEQIALTGVQQTIATGVTCTLYKGEAYDVGPGVAPDRLVPEAWDSVSPLDCAVWVDHHGLIRHIRVLSSSRLIGDRRSTSMLLAPGGRL